MTISVDQNQSVCWLEQLSETTTQVTASNKTSTSIISSESEEQQMLLPTVCSLLFVQLCSLKRKWSLTFPYTTCWVINYSPHVTVASIRLLLMTLKPKAVGGREDLTEVRADLPTRPLRLNVTRLCLYLPINGKDPQSSTYYTRLKSFTQSANP